MSGIEGVGSRIRLSQGDDEETKAIVARDTKVAIAGNDKTWPQVTEHQQSVSDNAICLAAHSGHAALEGAEISGLSHGVLHHAISPGIAGSETAGGGAAAGAGLVIVGAVGGLWLGVHELMEAHVKADQQKAALAKDDAHVALVGSLDLSASYKTKRLDGDYKHVAKGNQSPAFRMTEKIAADPKGRAILQLHADRGMNAARDLAKSGMTVEAFLKANPKVAEQYRKDAAFKEGFDAYLFTKANAPASEIREMERKLDDRDGWYAQSNVAIRV